MTREVIKGMVVLTADEDKMLTNGEVYSDKVYLGICDSEDNWSEVDAPAPEDEDASAADYLAALNELGVQ